MPLLKMRQGAPSPEKPPLDDKFGGGGGASFKPPSSEDDAEGTDDARRIAASSTEESDGASDHDADDPLMSLFRVHHTNRVKFELSQPSDEDGECGGGDNCDGDVSTDSGAAARAAGGSAQTAGGASRRIRRLVRSASATFSKRRNGSGSGKTPSNLTASSLLSNEASLLDDPEDAFIRKMLIENHSTPVRKFTASLFNTARGANVSNSDRGKSGSSSSSFGSRGDKSPSPPLKGDERDDDGANAAVSSSTADRATKEEVAKLLRRARRCHKRTFRYRHAMRYYLLALKHMTDMGYPDTHPLAAKVLKSLNDVHHAQSTVKNSANIVQMGIQHEDGNMLVKALRMYTVAYRMRRDVLGVDHPSLAVLLNMMGSVQVKRGEYGEAMKIYELSLKGRPDENGGRGRDKDGFRDRNPLTTSVTLRDMGMVFEHVGNEDKALKFYHASLKYSLKFKNAADEQRLSESSANGSDRKSNDNDWIDISHSIDEPFSLNEVRMAKSTSIGKTHDSAANGNAQEKGEMELFLEERFDRALSGDATATKQGDATKFYYDELFQSREAAQQQWQQRQQMKGEGPDSDIAMTLHQIGQIHRRNRRYDAALSAYNASLRGMKEVFGAQHRNIAAILGNMGNLYMETGDYDEAFRIYQQVLGVETLHLGLSHPEVAVTLHNIATIECSRGNFLEGVALYLQVVDMQKIRFGGEHLTVAITLTCLADAHEKLRNVSGAIKAYEEALEIRIAVLGKAHLDVGRLMHKLGRLASSREDYAAADLYASRAREIYATNSLRPEHVFMREMERDRADIQAGLAFKKK